MEPLSREQLDEIKAFTEGVGAIVFAQLQGAYVAEWLVAKTTIEREECWRMVQAVDRLRALLRDAEAMNQLSRRARDRLYEHTTKGV